MKPSIKTRYRNLWALALVVIALALVFPTLQGCNWSAANLKNPDNLYLQARQFLNDNWETYLDAFAKADEATQLRWRQEISPIFYQAHMVLNAWKMARSIGDSGSIAENRNKWRELKDKMIDALVPLEGD